MTLPRFRRQDADNLCMETGSLCIELFLESMGLVFKKTNNRSYEKNLGILKIIIRNKNDHSARKQELLSREKKLFCCIPNNPREVISTKSCSRKDIASLYQEAQKL